MSVKSALLWLGLVVGILATSYFSLLVFCAILEPDQRAHLIEHLPGYLQKKVIEGVLPGGPLEGAELTGAILSALGPAASAGVSLKYDRELLIPFLDGEKQAIRYNDGNFEQGMLAAVQEALVRPADDQLIDKVFQFYSRQPLILWQFCYKRRYFIDGLPQDYLERLNRRCEPHDRSG